MDRYHDSCKMFLSGVVPGMILVGISLVLTSWIGTAKCFVHKCTAIKDVNMYLLQNI